MIVTEVPVNITLPPPRTARSKGVHVSSIIRCIATEHGILKPEWAEEISLVDVRTITDRTAILRISIGLAWEEYYIPTHLGPLGILDHPGEMRVDGVYLTHDGESLDVIITPSGIRGVKWLHEVKATYKSTKTVGDLTTQWMWLAQMKAYCKGIKALNASMHTLFLCGDYSYPIKPDLKRWDIEFTADEIEDNWSLLTDYKRHWELMALKEKDIYENGTTPIFY